MSLKDFSYNQQTYTVSCTCNFFCYTCQEGLQHSLLLIPRVLRCITLNFLYHNFFFQFTGFLNQSAELEAESQQLIRMTQEVKLSINIYYQLSTINCTEYDERKKLPASRDCIIKSLISAQIQSFFFIITRILIL